MKIRNCGQKSWLAWVLAGVIVAAFARAEMIQAAESEAVAPASQPAAAAKLDTGDNAWMLTSSALVLMMTGPGLALFYSGLVRK